MLICNVMLIKSTSSTPDTPAAFAGNSGYDQAALTAATPTGYSEVFKDLDAAAITYYYLGFVTLTSYSPAACASACNSLALCSSFNICKRFVVAHVGTSLLTHQTLNETHLLHQAVVSTATTPPALSILSECLFGVLVVQQELIG